MPRNQGRQGILSIRPVSQWHTRSSFSGHPAQHRREATFEWIAAQPSTQRSFAPETIYLTCYTSNISLSGLAGTVRTPPLPDVDGFRSALRAGGIVMRGVLVHSNVNRAIERDEGELRQVDLVFLVEDVLALSRVSRGLLLQEQLIQAWVAVEGDVETVGRNLVAGKQARIVGVIGQRILELCDVIATRNRAGRRGSVAASEEGTEEGAGRVVLDVQLDTDGLHVGLENQFVVGAPQVVGRRRVLKFQTHAIFGHYAVRTRLPAMRLKQILGRRGIKGRAGGISLVARFIGLAVIGTERHGFTTPGRYNKRLMIYGHSHGLSHLRIIAQNGVVEVEVEGFEVGGVGVGGQRVVRQGL